MLIVGEFVVELDTTIVNVALPDMAQRLSASTSTLQWVIDSYTLMFGALLLVGGALGDRLGRRFIFLCGLALFAVGSILASTASQAGLLIAARGIMGLAAALILPTTLSILAHLFDAGERERAFSIWVAAAGLAFALGPTVGGALVQGFGWQAIFTINIPIIVIAVVGALAYIPRMHDSQSVAPDMLGGALSVAGLGMLLYAIIEAPKHGWGASATLIRFCISLISLALLIFWESRTDHPMLDLRILRSRVFSAAGISIGLTFLAISGSLFILTQYLQDVQGHSPLSAGLRLIPVAVAVGVSSPLSILVERRIGTKLTVAIGLLITACGLAIMTRMTRDQGYTLVFGGLVLAGTGMGLAMTPATNAILGAVSQVATGASTAIYNTTIVTGTALGVAILGSLLATSYVNHLTPQLGRFPPAIASSAQASVGVAVATAGTISEPGRQELITAAREAFTTAAAHTFLVASLIAAGGAIVAAAFLPRNPRVGHDGESEEQTIVLAGVERISA